MYSYYHPHLIVGEIIQRDAVTFPISDSRQNAKLEPQRCDLESALVCHCEQGVKAAVFASHSCCDWLGCMFSPTGDISQNVAHLTSVVL